MTEESAALSEREREVLQLVATGATNQQIARTLVISPNTVKVHLRNIFEKLGVQSRTEATMAAVRRGWVTVPGAPALDEEELAIEEQVAVRQPIARWERIYLVGAALVVLLVALAPGWWGVFAQSPRPTRFSDVGQTQSAPSMRLQVARWSSRAQLPGARSRFALVAAGSQLIAIGGETHDGVTGQVSVFDIAANAWRAGTRKPTAVANVGAALLEDRIYVPGGTLASGGVANALEVYTPATDSWEVRAPLPAPITAYALAALGDRVYLFGGWDGANYSSRAYCYDPNADQWAEITGMPAARAFLAAAALEDKIFVVGGYDGIHESDEVLVYDPAKEGAEGGPWSARAPLDLPRAGHAVTVLGSRLYAVGGGWDRDLAFNEQYDTLTGAWSRIGTPVAGQWRNLGLAALGQNLYAVGGWSGSYTAINEEYQALIRQLLPLGTKGG